MIAGTFAGAALGLAVSWFVTTLEEGPTYLTPELLLRAAHSDLEAAGYYRTSQVITVSIISDGPDDVIAVNFEAFLNIIRKPLDIECQDVGPPPGTSMHGDPVYRLGGNEVVKSDRIQSDSPDALVIRYKIDKDAKFPIEDEHFWPSPVLDYVVRFEKSPRFSFKVGTIRPAGELHPLNPKKSKSQKYQHFEGRGPAFSTQGLRWEIDLLARHDQ